MNIVGIVAEYNPFHNGHKFHIEKAKELSGADYTVAVISGNFVQRGEAAYASKWARAKAALLNGVDLVIELPVVFAAQSAEYFAKGAVGILDALGCVTHIAFGAETADIDKLFNVASFLASDDFKSEIASFKDKNISFPSARDIILENHGFSDVLKTPNNILAVEYIKQLIMLNSDIVPVAIERIGAEHDKKGNGNITSASHIRELDFDAISSFVPENVFEILKEEKQNGCFPIDRQKCEDIIMTKLRTMSKNELAEIAEISEGLENRIKECAIKATSLDEAVNMIKTKRYTHSRIRRIMINVLLGIKNTDLGNKLEYARVLGMNEKGKTLIKHIKETSKIPVITKVAKVSESRMLELDITATDVFSYLYPEAQKRTGANDFYNSPIIL